MIDAFAHSCLGTDTDTGVSYLLLSDDGANLVGFFSIEASRLDQDTGDNYLVPMGGAININYLALDRKYQRKRIMEMPEGEPYYIGDQLLNECENVIAAIGKEVGVSFITLHSSAEGYHMYHDRNGYEDFEEDMSMCISDSDFGCYQLYKWVGDIAE